MIDVLIVDDQPMMRFALRGILESAGDITVVGEAENGREALSAGRNLVPDLILLDLQMPKMDGLEVIRRIRADSDLASTRILVLTTFEHDENVLEAIHAGANGFIGKGVEPHDLIAAIRQVGHGNAILSPSATQSVMDHILSRATETPPTIMLSSLEQVQTLTPREREIIVLIASGLTVDQIADRLFISPYTVKTHVNNAMGKLGVHTRSQLVRVAIDYRLAD